MTAWPLPPLLRQRHDVRPIPGGNLGNRAFGRLVAAVVDDEHRQAELGQPRGGRTQRLAVVVDGNDDCDFHALGRNRRRPLLKRAASE